MSTLQPAFDAPPDPHRGTALPALVTDVPGPAGKPLIDLLAAHECPAITARRARRADATGVDQDPIVWERALGANVWDPDGNRFVDLTAGFGVASVGQSHPLVVERVTQQLQTHVHGMGDAFPGRVRIELAAALARLLPAPLEQVLFGSDGSDAVEAALKTAVVATGRARFVGFEGSYHGLSLGALTVSHYKAPFRAPFAGLMGPTADWIPFGCDEEILVDALSKDPPAAVIVEPIQGRGGDRTAPPGWFAMLRRVCDEHGVLLIFDEIFTGFGRAGAVVQAGTEHVAGVVPDLLCVGKGMTSGFPLSACVGSRAVMGAWGHSAGEAIHTSTFLGHPIGCAAALAVIELIDHHGLIARANALGDHMERTLSELVGRHERLLGVRGRGAMRGLHVAGGIAATLPICRALLQRGWIVLPAGTQGEVISFTPALTMTRAQWDGAIAALEAVL